MLTILKQVLLRLVNSQGFQFIIKFYRKLFGIYSKDAMQIVGTNKIDGKLIILHVLNKEQLEGKKALKYLFNLLKNTDTFVNFGYRKVIFVIANYDDVGEKSYHQNVLITNDTSFDKYWDKVKDFVQEKYISGTEGYSQSIVNVYTVFVWNMDLAENSKITITKNATGSLESQITPRNGFQTTSFKSSTGFLASTGFPKNRVGFLNKGFLSTGFLNKGFLSTGFQTSGFHTSSILNKNRHKNYIKPLTPKQTKIVDSQKRFGYLNPFSTLDIETMDFHGNQVPISISFSSYGLDENITNKFFMIKYSDLNLINGFPVKDVLDNLIKDMWLEFINYLKENKKPEHQTIFVHNLGGFDGMFIFSNLVKILDPIKPDVIIDDSNKFIRITLELCKGYKVKWVDSYRLFPVSLDDLCKNFSVLGKTQKYDENFNKFSLFNNIKLLKRFVGYSMQDSSSLATALSIAQAQYFDDYKVDITTCLSASSLAFKIFRTRFLKINIPILKHSEDRFVRNSYFGGATDVYKAVVKSLHYIDVNSLYPKAMLNYMPLDLLEVIYNKSILNKLDLDNFFGFLKVEVECPKSLKRPVLPVKNGGKTIFPTGSWTATYFSEEIKAVLKLDLGYKIRIIEAHRYSKAMIFKEFIEHFYAIKKTATGAAKFLAKLCLNSLYGMFGRKQDPLDNFVVDGQTLFALASTRFIQSISVITNNLFLVSVSSNVKSQEIGEINSVLETNFTSNHTVINSNVAIASAVTAYARIYMMEYKQLDCVIYTDTDSFFTTDLKPFLHLISSELGDFKDELNGLVISNAIFLGIKQYCYQYFNTNNELVTKSVFAGVKRDTLNFEDYTDMLQGKEIHIKNGNRFHRSLSKFSIQILNTN